jgi:hypothetical protein
LTRPRRGSAPRATVLALLPFLVAACASQQPEHPASLSAHAPARWETVFLTPPAAAELTDYDESLLPGYARHDDDIN